jgi:hypothetical protein
MEIAENISTIYLCPEVKHESQWTNFNKIHNSSTGSLGNPLYQASHKLIKKYLQYRYKFIYTLKYSTTITKPIAMKLMFAQ